MPPSRDLPLSSSWKSEDEYVQSLLSFATGTNIFRNLCGGIHILDFLTREPDLYSTVLPKEWRSWFELVSIDDILDLLLREDLEQFAYTSDRSGVQSWRGVQSPPCTLVEYVATIRKHSLLRQYENRDERRPAMARHIAVGMKPKKSHEVSEFAAYVDTLSADLASYSSDGSQPTIVDFGSGQNYLGRTLASPPYDRQVIAIERKHHNIDGAKGMDVLAKLTKKEKIMRNKKEYKRQLAEGRIGPNESAISQIVSQTPTEAAVSASQHVVAVSSSGKGSMTYLEHEIEDGNLESILYPDEFKTMSDSDCSTSNESSDGAPNPPLLVVSLHSCGNLIHHGIRSLVLNPSVTAVAMIGCCYNLMTERLGPATYKLPQLRPNHPRLVSTSSACDPHGFPMSKTLESYHHPNSTETGVRLNITARMMAVQAPYNWGPGDSEAFFKRHFYRALLQRILLDRGVVKQCSPPNGVGGGDMSNDGNSLSGKDSQGTPLIVGSLRKSHFTSFRAYVHGALAKLTADPVDGPVVRNLTCDLADGEIDQYASKWAYAKKHLAVIWSLMAFSAGVVESLIAVDRWLFLREQDCVERCWVEAVFDYALSPRNLVVVGMKRRLRGRSTTGDREEGAAASCDK